MRTPTGFCASTSRKGPTSADTAPTILRPWPQRSTDVHARPWIGGLQPRHSTTSYPRLNKPVLRRPVEPGLGAVVGMVHGLTGQGSPSPQRHLQRVDHELGAHVVSD